MTVSRNTCKAVFTMCFHTFPQPLAKAVSPTANVLNKPFFTLPGCRSGASANSQERGHNLITDCIRPEVPL